MGQIYVEIHDATLRNRTSDEIINFWREEAGVFPGAERVTYRAANIGPGGKPLEFKILAPRDNAKELELAVEEAKAALAEFGGVYDIQDDNGAGKIEFQFTVKDTGKAARYHCERFSRNSSKRVLWCRSNASPTRPK